MLQAYRMSENSSCACSCDMPSSADHATRRASAPASRASRASSTLRTPTRDSEPKGRAEIRPSVRLCRNPGIESVIAIDVFCKQVGAFEDASLRGLGSQQTLPCPSAHEGIERDAPLLHGLELRCIDDLDGHVETTRRAVLAERQRALGARHLAHRSDDAHRATVHGVSELKGVHHPVLHQHGRPTELGMALHLPASTPREMGCRHEVEPAQGHRYKSPSHTSRSP